MTALTLWQRVRQGAPGAVVGRVGRALVRDLWAPAVWAAVAICAFELVRTWFASQTALGGIGGGAAFGLAVLGVLGLPLACVGAGLLALARAIRGGWRWGIGDAPWPAERAVAVGIYLALAAVVLIAGVQKAALGFSDFKQQIYRGLAVGLVATVLASGLVALAGPGIGALARAVRGLADRVPDAVSPLASPGRWVWAALCVIAAMVAPTMAFSELETVDLRPPRLALAWLCALIALSRAGRGRDQLSGSRTLGAAFAGWRRARPIVLGAVTAALIAGGIWSAGAVGDSQRRLLALHRDTALARLSLRALQRLADRDGDGASRLFGGGDCNDRAPAIRPGRYDAPGDGVDANCTGADLVLADDPLPVVIRKDVPQTRPRPAPKPAVAAAGSRAPMNVVLLTIDALRADTARAFMPNLAALAADGIDYRHAYANGAATYWSIPALIGSKVPSRFAMARDQTPVAGELLLAEVLADRGWHTAMFANVTIFFVRGLRQGFHEANYNTNQYTLHGKKPGAIHLTDQILAHLGKWKQRKVRQPRDRFLFWAHYYDPHVPYFEIPGFPADGGGDRARYEAIVRWLDAALGRLFDGLRAAGVWDDTIVIVTADHGEEFGDHGHRFHGNSLYEEVSHVPLVVRVPGLEPRVIDTPIEHRELAPTLLDLLGEPIPAAFTGRSRADELETGEPAPAEPIFLEILPDRNYGAHQVGVVLGDQKLIYRIGDNTFEFYDLANDPRERVNRYDDDPRARALATLLMRYTDHHLYWLGRGKTGARVPPGSPKAR